MGGGASTSSSSSSSSNFPRRAIWGGDEGGVLSSSSSGGGMIVSCDTLTWWPADEGITYPTLRAPYWVVGSGLSILKELGGQFG
jgi:hypothetical protein